MATTAVATSTYEDVLKQIVAKGVLKVMPEVALLQQAYEFDRKQLVGQTFEQLVTLQLPSGHNFGGSQPTVNTSLGYKAGVVDRAVLRPYEYALRDVIPLAMLSRGASASQAIEETLTHFVSNATQAARTALEITALHGQHYGQGVARIVSAARTTDDIGVITVDGFSPALLCALEGQYVDAWYDNSGTPTARNSAVTGMLVTAVNPEASSTTGTLTVTKTNCATSSATYLNNDNDWLDLAGAYSSGWQCQQGILNQIERSTGTDFGINRATYTGFRGQTYTVSGAISETVVMRAVSKSMARGFVSGKMTLWVNPDRFTTLNAAIYAKRSFDSSYVKSKAELGNGRILLTNGTVDVEVKAHPFMFTDIGLLLPDGTVSRKGSEDLTLTPPGRAEMFMHIPGSNAGEIVTYSDQQVFAESPAWCVYLSGLTS